MVHIFFSFLGLKKKSKFQDFFLDLGFFLFKKENFEFLKNKRKNSFWIKKFQKSENSGELLDFWLNLNFFWIFLQFFWPFCFFYFFYVFLSSLLFLIFYFLLFFCFFAFYCFFLLFTLAKYGFTFHFNNFFLFWHSFNLWFEHWSFTPAGPIFNLNHPVILFKF